MRNGRIPAAHVPRERFHILSLKHSRPGAPLVWWRADQRGYTLYVDEAGVYTLDQVRADYRLYGSPASCAVPVEALRGRTSPARITYVRPAAPVVHRRYLTFLRRDWLAPIGPEAAHG